MKDTKRIPRHFFVFLGVAFAVVVLDQITKFFIMSNPAAAVVHNTGAAFGLFRGSAMLFVWFALIVIGIILYFYSKIPRKAAPQIFVAIILGGTIANLIDRIRLGFVIDFIDMKFWPAFNIADAAITVGVICLIIYLLKKK